MSAGVTRFSASGYLFHLLCRQVLVMPEYRVTFSPDWIKGRWGFTDRLFTQLKGKRYPSEVVSAWVVRYRGNPANLGRLLMSELNIQPTDFENFGAIFEISPREENPATKRLAIKGITSQPAQP